MWQVHNLWKTDNDITHWFLNFLFRNSTSTPTPTSPSETPTTQTQTPTPTSASPSAAAHVHNLFAQLLGAGLLPQNQEQKPKGIPGLESSLVEKEKEKEVDKVTKVKEDAEVKEENKENNNVVQMSLLPEVEPITLQSRHKSLKE